MEKLSSAENYNGEVDHHGGRRIDESQEIVEIVTLQEFSQLLLSQPKIWNSGSRQRPQIQEVPPQVRRRKEQREHVYGPLMVSLGPYHHGKPELSRAEGFKHLCLDWCARGNEKKKAFFYNMIIEKIEVIRDCYAEGSIVEKFDVKALALMMLLDACIIINFIHNSTCTNRNNFLDWQKCLGAGSRSFMFRDMMVLENQIPFQILTLLISLQYEKEEAEGFFQRYFSRIASMDLNQMKIPVDNEDPPLHFLEACWRVATTKNNSQPNRRAHNQLVSKFRWPRFLMREEKNNRTNVPYAHRSVMDLKAKGIQVRPCSSTSIMDITFTSHTFHGQLQLPVVPISETSIVTFSNLIAYELSPNNSISLVVLSFVILMKSLIQRAEDVKELQKKGILSKNFASHEKAVKLFKQIDTFGLQDHDQDIFKDVKQQIEEHCNNKVKTWIADLIHTRFRTPWTAIALFVAFSLLCLTFLQTFFTIRPIK